MALASITALWAKYRPQSPSVAGTVAIRVPGATGRDGVGGTSVVISPSTPTQSLTANYLLRVSADGTHVDQLNPNTFDAAGTAATSMAAHIANLDPHNQYLQKTTAATTYAPIASPTFTGTPAAPTAAANTNTTQVATTQYVVTALTTLNATNITTGTLADSRLTTNIPLIGASQNTFLGTLSTPKVSIPALVTGLTNPFVIRSNTGGTFTEPSHYLGIQGSETTGITFRSNGQTQFMGQVSVGQFNDIQLGGSGTPFGFTRGSAQNFQLGGVADITADAGTGTSVSIGASATTSTTAKQGIWKQLCSWLIPTQATRLGQIEEFVADYLTWRRSRRVYSDGARAYTAFTVHTTAPADADLQNSELAFHTDSSSNLLAKLKDATGVVHAINATGGGGGGTSFAGPINYPVAVASSGSGYSPYYDSRSFSAIIGDGTTDDAAAVRSAIATIAAAGGGTLYMAPVRASGVNAAYKFSSALGVIPPNVSIKGPFETSALGIGNRFYGTDASTTLDDSFLTDPMTIPGVWLIYADSGTTTNSFMKPWKNSTISGIAAYYPSQAKIGSAGTPTQYPFFIEVGNGSQVTLKDLGVVNPYQLIFNNGGWRTVIDNVTAQPYSVGIKINNSYDVSRVTRVHFECFWDAYEPTPGGFSCPWSANFGYAFIIQRCDLTQVMDCFAYGYRYGAVLQSSDGTQPNSPWATFTNCHFDLCGSSVIAQQTQKYGASFSNCMFTYNGGASVVDSQSTNDGLLSFSNCLFVGNDVGVTQAGSGEVNLSGCTFDVITGGSTTTTFLNHTGGGLYATGNNFRADKPQYANTSGAASALLVGNRVKGTVRVPNTATITNFLAANNLAS